MALPQNAFVVRRAEMDARHDAAAILAAARQAAAAARDEARTQGFQEGLEAGTRSAVSLLDALRQMADGYWAEREAELVEVALAIAHRVVTRLPPEELLCELARTAVAEHRRDAGLVLHAAPAAARVLQLAFADDGHIAVRAEPAFPEGRIVLKHGAGQTEAGLLSQFRAMMARAKGL